MYSTSPAPVRLSTLRSHRQRATQQRVWDRISGARVEVRVKVRVKVRVRVAHL